MKVFCSRSLVKPSTRNCEIKRSSPLAWQCRRSDTWHWKIQTPSFSSLVFGDHFVGTPIPEQEPKKTRNTVSVNPNPNIQINTNSDVDIGLMYPQPWYPRFDPTGWWCCDKLDGIRAYWDGSKLHFRHGGLIEVPQWFTKEFPSVQLDGELCIGKGYGNQVHDIIKRTQDWDKVRYHVFDAPGEVNLKYEERMDYLKDLLANKQYVLHVPVRKCDGLKDMNEHLEKVIKEGGNGVMLRRPQSYYESGVSSAILKYEKHNYMEGRLIEQQGNVLHLCTAGNHAVDVEIPSDHALYDQQLPVGAVVKFTYIGIDERGYPQEPKFYRWKSSELWHHDLLKDEQRVHYFVSYGVKIGGVPKCCGCRETLRDRKKLRVLVWGTYSYAANAPSYPTKYAFCTKKSCIEKAFHELKFKKNSLVYYPKFDGIVRIPPDVLETMSEKDEQDLVEGDLLYWIMTS